LSSSPLPLLPSHTHPPLFPPPPPPLRPAPPFFLTSPRPCFTAAARSSAEIAAVAHMATPTLTQTITISFCITPLRSSLGLLPGLLHHQFNRWTQPHTGGDARRLAVMRRAGLATPDTGWR